MIISDTIKSRKSIRKFESTPVTKDQIHALLEAAMLAPSACNTRPWEFIVVTNRDKLNEVAQTHPHAKMLATSPVAIIVCALPDVQKGIATGFFPQDCGAATQNILLQAQHMGLGSCWCGVYPKDERIREIQDMFDLSSGSIPFNIIAIGTPAEEPATRGFYEEDKVKWAE